MRIFLFLMALFITGPAQAQEPLTEDRIKAFYQEMIDVQFKNREPKVLEAFFNKYIRDDLTYSIMLKKDAMGEKRPDETLILTKSELLKRALTMHKGGADGFNVSVLKTEISADGRQAKTKVRRMAEFLMDTKGRFGMDKALMVQRQTCEDTLTLSTEDVLQLAVSLCQGDVIITKPQESKIP